MSAISGISSGYGSVASSSSATDDVDLGKEDFLLLLVAQLENQDPMNPSDPTEFTSQLAQFSQLEQLTNVNKSLEDLSAMSTDMERMSALGMIGQDVVAATSSFAFDGDALELGYRLDNPAEEVKLYVLNPSGSTVATLTAEETSAGDHFVSWDGNGDLGEPLDPGAYSLVVRALDEDDDVLSSAPLLKGTVEGVDLSSAQTQLETSAGIFTMSKVERVGSVQ